MGLGRTTVCGPRLDVARATGLWCGIGEVTAAVTAVSSCGPHGVIGGAVVPGAAAGGSPPDGGVWPRATASDWTAAAATSIGSPLDVAAVVTVAGEIVAAVTAAGGCLLAAAGSCDSSARDTDLARYSTSRRPTTESRPGNDNRKLHASLAQ